MKQFIKKYNNLPVQAKASVWFLICMFFQKGISMLSTPVFTRLLSTTEYGKYSVFNSWLSIITIIVSLQLSYGVYTQGLIKFEEDEAIFSSSLQGLTTSLVFVWIIIYSIFHRFWNNLFSLTTIQSMSMLIMIWTTAAFNFWAAEQRVHYRYQSLVILTILVSLAKPLLGIFFVLTANDKVTARILGLLLVEVICYTGLYIYQMRKGKVFFSARFWKYALCYNIPLIPHYLSQIVLSSSDRIMISKMIGDSEAGIYSLAYALSAIMVLFNSALMQTLSPWIYQKIKRKSIKDIETTAYLSLILIAAVNLILILLAPEAVAVFAPRTYREAIYVIPPVAMSVYFMYSYDLFAKFAFYYEKTKLIMTASIMGAILNVVLNFIFIGKYGYIAAGYTTLLCYMIYSIAHYILMRVVCKKYCDGVIPYETKILLGITGIFLIIGFAFLASYDFPLIRYGLIIVLFLFLIINHKNVIQFINRFILLKKES